MKISQRETHYKGNKLWAFPDVSQLVSGDGFTVEVTYNDDLEFIDYLINRVPITQDDFIVELADCFDNDQERAYIMDHERTEREHPVVVEDRRGKI